MSYFPMRQKLTINRGSGELDGWGNPVPGLTLEMKCRADEGSYTPNNSGGRATGTEEVAQLKFMLDKLADIRYDDELQYVNEFGKVYEGTPKRIRVLRDIAGKPVMTEVLL